MLRIGVCEDDPGIRRVLTRALEGAGHSVVPAHNGAEALTLLAPSSGVDVLIMDVGLPDADGRDVLQALRANGQQAPALFLTALGDTHDLLAGFAAGADDYVVKPFDYGELLGRVEAVLRRARGRVGAGALVVGELSLDPVTRKVRLGDEPVTLSAKEFALLHALARQPTKVFSKTELLRDVWGYMAAGKTRTVDAHACRLRKKLGRRWVIAVRGIGYRLVEAE
jgi:DNA-binding response OmpR family regulator